MDEIVIVDLFCGCGGASEGALAAAQQLGLGVKVYAINCWQAAVDTYKANHPYATVICQRVEQVIPEQLVPGRRVHLLVAGPECFPAGTLVLTTRGIIPIEKVVIGDYVLTHRGRWMPVTRTMKTVKDTTILKGHGHYGLESSAPHPFYSRTASPHWRKPANGGPRSKRLDFTEPDWVPAEDMVGKYWATPTSFEELPIPEVGGRGVEFNDWLWWVVGRWLGDGSVRVREHKSEITICCGFHEADALELKLNQYFPKGREATKDEFRWHRRSVRTGVLFEMSHHGLAQWLVTNFGKLAHGKTVPAWVFGMKAEWKRALLDGYTSADGWQNFRKKESWSVSKKVALGIRLIAESLGYRVALHKQKARKNPIEGRTVNVRDQYHPVWIKERKHEYCFADNGHSWLKVKKLLPGRKNVKVFNLSVLEDESFTADGIVVHNCTHHSVARGGMPVDDQRRVPAWVVPNWLQRMVVDHVIIENVPEFQSWGPLGANNKPLKSKRGEIFKVYLDTIRACGYQADYKVLCCADYGDVTTRKRLFIQAWRKGTPRWPVQTHVSQDKLRGQTSLFLTTPVKRWRAAREIIDWNLKGQNIFDRKKPLAPKTMKRIAAGMKKINGFDLEPYLVKLYGTGKTVSVETPLPTVTAGGNHLGLAEPFVLSQASGGAARAVSNPVPTICAKGAEQLIEPFIVDQFNDHKAKPVSDPLGTITTTSRGVRLLEPFVIPIDHQGRLAVSRSAEKPLTTITTKARHAVADPFLVSAGGPKGKGRQPHSVKEPLSTVLTENHEALVEPFLMVVNHGDKGSSSAAARCKSIDDPMPTATAENTFAVVEPELVSVRAQNTEAPLPTLTTRNGQALVEPFLTKYFGTGTFAEVQDPLDTVTTKDRFGLVEPKLLKIGEGLYLGIRFRMLQDYELAGAHGFPRSFKFTKKKSVNVKLVGNSWPRETATQLCLQALRNYAKDEYPVLPLNGQEGQADEIYRAL